jgi:ABC-type uncharacterized transport system substrate-binding protein
MKITFRRSHDRGASFRLPSPFSRLTREISEGAQLSEAGGLVSYGPNIPDLFRRASDFVDKILRGAKPADLPVEQPTKFDLIVNLKTVKALGLEVPLHF